MGFCRSLFVLLSFFFAIVFSVFFRFTLFSLLVSTNVHYIMILTLTDYPFGVYELSLYNDINVDWLPFLVSTNFHYIMILTLTDYPFGVYELSLYNDINVDWLPFWCLRTFLVLGTFDISFIYEMSLHMFCIQFCPCIFL